MIPILFDQKTKKDLLDSIEFYEDCQQSLGKRLSKSVEKAIQKIIEAHFRLSTLLNLTTYALWLFRIQKEGLGPGYHVCIKMIKWKFCKAQANTP